MLLDWAWRGRRPPAIPTDFRAPERRSAFRLEASGVSAQVVLRPGRTPLADWRAFYGGATVELDPVARVDVEAGQRRARRDPFRKAGTFRPEPPADRRPSPS